MDKSYRAKNSQFLLDLFESNIKSHRECFLTLSKTFSISWQLLQGSREASAQTRPSLKQVWLRKDWPWLLGSQRVIHIIAFPSVYCIVLLLP